MKRLLLLIIISVYGVNSWSQAWQDVGGGTNNSSHGMLVWNNQLINLGSFNAPCNRVASWDGSNWNCLGGGVGIVARAGTVWDGKLVVVGDFWNVQQPCVGCNGVAVWDGTTWEPLGNGVNNDVLSVTVWNNELVIAGDFTSADGVAVARIVKWNGSVWESVGPIGSFDNDIRAMTEFEGELWVGGDFNNVGGNPPSDGLVKYDPITADWLGGNSGVDLVGGVNESVRVLYVNPNDGNLYMGGEFPELQDGDELAEDFNMGGVAMYDGSNWTPLGTGLNEYCRAMHEYNGDLVVGGYFTDAGGTPANKIAKWNPVTSSWSAMGSGFDAGGIDEYVKSAAVWNGIFFAGGAYTQAEGNPMNYISQWYEAPSSAPVAWITSSSSSVCGSGCIDFLDNSTNAPTSWTWTFSGADIVSSTDQNPGSICWTAEGTYDVTLESCNSFGCNTQTLEIIVGAGSVAVDNVSVCDGISATIDAIVSETGGTYLWSPDGETSASITVNPISNQSYTVTYTMGGCSSSATSNVTVNTTPTVTVNTTTPTICDGESTVIAATPSVAGGTYSWLPDGETNASISVSPSILTNYSVEYTINGCTSTAESIDINVNETPLIAASDETICTGETATIITYVSTLGGTYDWSPGGETGASLTVSPTITTIYDVVYTLNGCPSMIESGTVTVNEIPVIIVSDETICSGMTATLTTTVSTTGGVYSWSPDGEITPSINVSPVVNASYDVTYTLDGCASTLETGTVSVTELPDVTTTVADNIITASQNGATYIWLDCDNGNSVVNGENGQSFAPSINGNYAVEVTLDNCSDVSQCSTISTIGIEEVDTESIEIYPNPVSELINIQSSVSLINKLSQILDASGKVVIAVTLDNSQAINVSSLAPGFYILRIENSNYRFVKK